MVAASVKRAIDLVGAGLLLIAAAPVIAGCALAIRIVSPGPAILRQCRFGLRGKPFEMFKLRTMHVNAADLLPLHLAQSPERRAEWERFGRLRDDPRVIPVAGTFLRRTSLDELPQLWNVLRGEMSLVGPRPLDLALVGKLPGGALERRARMRPGLTGLWQVSGRSELDMDALLALDIRYVTEWSLWRDFVILLRTPAAVLTRRGAY